MGTNLVYKDLLLKLVACGNLLLLTLFAHSAELETAKQARPKIGLALSGGGARGAAHIGVLMALEARNIPIDYIAGTSMGAIVGSLYASGYTPSEIQKITEELDWDGAFKDDVDRAKRSYRRKQDDSSFSSAVRLGLDIDGIKLPSGIVSGQSIDLILSELLAPVSHIKHFDHLKIPFRAVATDIVTGEEVVMGTGALSTAVRASMSIPGIVTPIEREGRLLIDGGSANNLPISVVRSMGADIIIAVDISTPFYERHEINDVVDVANQLSGFLTRRNTETQIAQLTDSDFLILPELGTIATGDFDRVAEAIPTGLAAVDKLPEINALSQQVPERQNPQLTLAERRVAFIRLTNQSTIPDSVLVNRLKVKAGDKLDLHKIEHDVDTLYGLGYFSNVTYQLVEEHNQLGVEIVATEKTWGPNYLNVGLRFSTSEDTDNRVSLSADYLMTNMNSLGGELRTGVSLGTDQRLEVDYYQPLDSEYTPFIQPNISWTSKQINLFVQDRLLVEFTIESLAADLGLGIEIANWGEFKLGTLFAKGNVDQRVGPKLIDKESYDDALVYAAFGADTVDSLYFPRSGYRFNIHWQEARESLGADQPYEQLLTDANYSMSFDQHSVTGLIRYYRSFDQNIPVQAVFRSGGFLNLSGFEYHQLTGYNYGQVSLIYMYQLQRSFMPVYLGTSLERGNTWFEDRDAHWNDLIGAFSAFVGVDTALGPFFFAYGYNEEHNKALYMRLDSAL